MTDDEDDLDREDRRTRILREAREIVKQHKRETAERREKLEKQSPEDVAHTLLPLPEDRVAKWRREMDAIAEVHAAEAAELHTRSGADDLVYKRHDNAIDETRAGHGWVEWIDGRIDAAIEAEREATTEGFGEAIRKILDEERRDILRTLRGELTNLKIEASKLAAEVADLRVQLAQHAIDRAKVVEMPSPLARRVN
jgi:hypothetical protein